MALDPSNRSNLEQLALKGLKSSTPLTCRRCSEVSADAQRFAQPQSAASIRVTSLTTACSMLSDSANAAVNWLLATRIALRLLSLTRLDGFLHRRLTSSIGLVQHFCVRFKCLVFSVSVCVCTSF